MKHTSWEAVMAHDLKHGKKKSRRLLLITIVVVILAIIIIPIAYILHLVQKTNYDNSMDEEIITNEEIAAEDTQTGYQNFVIFGVDSRSNVLTSGTRSDTIMIVSINKDTKQIKLCSVYRDTYVNIPNSSWTKINHAYAKGGYSLALSTINTNFDLDINQYVTVNFYAVTKVIDLLGGITLDITQDELKWLNGYVRENNRVNGTNDPGLTHSGTQTVTGTQALAYARIRYTSGGDFKRAERQRIVVDKIFEKAKEADLVTINRIINEMLPEISTNINTYDILTLAKDMFSYELTESVGFPFENTITKIHGVSYVVPVNYTENVRRLHEYLFGELNYNPSSKVTENSAYLSSLGY